VGTGGRGKRLILTGSKKNLEGCKQGKAMGLEGGGKKFRRGGMEKFHKVAPSLCGCVWSTKKWQTGKDLRNAKED